MRRKPAASTNGVAFQRPRIVDKKDLQRKSDKRKQLSKQ
jgi:hypothetical protein